MSKTRHKVGRVSVLRSCRDAVKWYRLWGTMPVRSWIKAAACFKQQDFRSAIIFYQRGLETHASHPAAQSARLDLAYCKYRLNEIDEAYEELTTLVDGCTPLKDAYLLRSKIALIYGHASSALQTMERCLEYYPSDAKVISQYAHLALLNSMDPSQAEEVKQRLVGAKCRLSIEDHGNVLLDTALAHYEMVWGDIRRGERVLARVLATGRAPFEAVLLRGERLLAQGRILPARELLTRAMRMSSRDPRPVMMLSASYLRSGASSNLDWALQLAEAACRLSHWRNAECLGVLASVYEAKGDKGGAQLFLERTKHLPSGIEPQLSFASFHAQLGKVSNS